MSIRTQPKSQTAIAVSPRAEWIGYLRTAVICAVLLTAAELTRSSRPFVSVPYYLPLHMVLEMSSIVVSFAVAATAWYGYRQTRSSRDLLLGAAFLTTGIIDMIHTLSYEGMPDFLSVNDPGTAAAYWLLGRLVFGIGLLAACFVGARRTSGRTALAGYLVTATAIIATAMFLMARNEPASGRLFYNQAAGGLTNLKIGLEYIIVVIYAGAFLFLDESHGWEHRTALLLRYALIVAVFSELAFTLYLSPYSYVNALGHILKTGAYVLILSALFASVISKPYEQLERTNKELQAMYARAQEQSREIQQSVSRVGHALSSSLELDEALNQIAGLVGDMLHAECAIVALADRRTGRLRMSSRSGLDSSHALPEDIILKLSQRTMTSQCPVRLGPHQAECGDCDLCSALGLASLMSVPMVHDGSTLGAISIFSDKSDAFGSDEQHTLEAFASHAAVAVHNTLRYGLESHVANVLQNAILECTEPALEGYQVAHIYEAAVKGTLAGGDFFDVVALPDGKVAFSIGDVSGKGVEAAVHTAMIKYSLRAHLRTQRSLPKIMGLLNQAVYDASSGEMFVTMFLGLLDLKTGELTCVNAGHVPPIYARAGDCSLLEPTGSILGLELGLGFTESKVVLEPGGVLVLYTDGISEARVGSNLFGTERIVELVCSSASLGVDAMVSGVRNAAVGFAGELKDDAAILALSRDPDPSA